METNTHTVVTERIFKKELAARELVNLASESEPRTYSIREAHKALSNRGIQVSRDTAHKALKLLESLLREDVEEYGPAGPRLYTPLLHAKGRGIFRRQDRLGGWYLDVHEADLEARWKERNLSKMQQNWVVYVRLTMEMIRVRANRHPRAFNLLVRLLRGPFREEAEEMGLVFDEGKILVDSVLGGMLPYMIRRYPRLTWFPRVRASRWLRRPDLANRPRELAQTLERAMECWRSWEAL